MLPDVLVPTLEYSCHIYWFRMKFKWTLLSISVTVWVECPLLIGLVSLFQMTSDYRSVHINKLSLFSSGSRRSSVTRPVSPARTSDTPSEQVSHLLASVCSILINKSTTQILYATLGRLPRLRRRKQHCWNPRSKSVVCDMETPAAHPNTTTVRLILILCF